MKRKALVLCTVISLLMSSVSVNAMEITETANTEIVTEATEMPADVTEEVTETTEMPADVTAGEAMETASEEAMVSETEAIPEVATENEEVLQGVSASNIKLSGVAHVQGRGDVAGVWDSKTNTLKLGTTGQSKRLEAITLNLENNTGYEGTIRYRVHRQTYGWTDYLKAGNQAGTTGEAKRLEGIQIYLTGELAEHYSVRYRVHIQTYGWSQGWQYDSSMAGTEGEAKRLEALEIQIVPRTEEKNVIYRVHRQTTGWEKTYSKNGEVAGTTGQGKRLEAIEIALTGNDETYSFNDIRYYTYVQSYGWDTERGSDSPCCGESGTCAGTIGKGKRMEAIRIDIYSAKYDVYYRVHAQSYGWLGWAKNGEIAGTMGYGKRLEAIQIVLKRKGEAAPGEVYKGVKQNYKYSFAANEPTNDVNKLTKLYGYCDGEFNYTMGFEGRNNSRFEAIAGGVLYYKDKEGGVDIVHKDNNYFVGLISTKGVDGKEYFAYPGAGIYAGDNGYEYTDIKYYTEEYKNGRIERVEASEETNKAFNDFLRKAIANINGTLRDNGLSALKR